MTLSCPSQLSLFLSQFDARAKKSLSQNFLIDGNIVRKIVDAADIKPGDAVLEIGPGPGALTQELLRRGARCFAVEKDALFARELSRLGDLVVYKEDFMEFPLREQLERFAPLKVVSNLPYHLTSPILGKICDASDLFTSATVMVQREVAVRMVGIERGPLSLFLNVYSEASLAIKVVSRNCFTPVPNVDSSVVHLKFKTPPLTDPKPFLSWARKAFQQRRKMLRSTLGITHERYATARPEELSLEDWLSLWDSI